MTFMASWTRFVRHDASREPAVADPRGQIQTNDEFALKQLNNGEIVDFEREVKALMRFSGFDHPHMVTLLMTWTLDKRYYLLFPLAACDLDKYWRDNPQPVLDEGMAMWMAKQMVGIASALEHIHDPQTQGSSLPVPSEEFGRHGDLKPENILLYDSPIDERGILVVADFGLAKLNSILSRTQTNTHTPCSPRYKAPECDILGAKVSRVYDIWTLGCVILEWVCWVFEGELMRNRFMESLFAPFPSGSQSDMFFNMVRKPGGEYDVIVKSQVRQVSVFRAYQFNPADDISEVQGAPHPRMLHTILSRPFVSCRR